VAEEAPELFDHAARFLALNDLSYLLTVLLNRRDLDHDWLQGHCQGANASRTSISTCGRGYSRAAPAAARGQVGPVMRRAIDERERQVDDALAASLGGAGGSTTELIVIEGGRTWQVRAISDSARAARWRCRAAALIPAP
jgi:hypothetical protein